MKSNGIRPTPAPTGETSQTLSNCRCLLSREVNARRLTICQPDQLAIPLLLETQAHGGHVKNPIAGIWCWTVATQVAGCPDNRASRRSGLGVSRTPRAWRARKSKTLTADDNNFILMQRLGYESPSRGSRAMHCLCIFARGKYTWPSPHLDHPFGDGGSYRRSEPCFVVGTGLGSSPDTIEFMTKLSLWCHRQRSPLS